MSKATIAKLSASVSLGNGIECVTVNMNVNTTSTAELQMGQKTSKVVVEPLASEVLAEIRGHQKKRLEGVASPDVTLNVDDDIYGKLSMTGFLASPMLEISDGNIGYQVNILDKASILDGLDLSIYEHSVDMLRQAEIPDTIPRPTGDVCKLLLELTNMLVENYGDALGKEQDPVKKRIIQMRHELNNSGPLEAWRAILSKSKVRHESWAAMLDLHENAGKHISYKTLNMLCTKSSGFWNVVNMIMSAFQMFYRPSLSDYGEFVNNKDKVEGESGSIDLDAVNLNVRDGSARILQVGGVIMEAGGAAGFRDDETTGTTPACAGVYPEEIKKGYIHTEVPPIWLIDASGAPVMGSKVDEKKTTPPGNDEVDLSLSGYQGRRDGGKEHLKAFDKSRNEVMTELCKYMFKDLQLADSVISARIPLNLTIAVGKRQTIRLGEAGSIKGFVSAVTHRIDLRQGKELDSFSQVNITHVEY